MGNHPGLPGPDFPLIRRERKVENYFGMLHFVCAWITYRSAGLMG